jgi:hypothetical protein
MTNSHQIYMKEHGSGQTMLAAPWVLLKVPNAREHHSEGHRFTSDK